MIKNGAIDSVVKILLLISSASFNLRNSIIYYYIIKVAFIFE